jgi:transposase
MDETRVTMTIKELKRLQVMHELEAGRITNPEAAEVLGVSKRQVIRWKKTYREKGAVGLAHGHRGKVSARRTPEEVRERIAKLLRERYRDYNTLHLVEVLAEEHGIAVSYATLRRIRLAVGVPSPRKRRAPRHRGRRERRPMAGMLLQADGSDHDWLEGRGPGLTLIAFIDDATNEVPTAIFRQEEDAAGYMLGLREICQTRGVPLALYADRHTIFRSPKEATLEQQLAGDAPRPKSQFGRCLDELAVQYIPAYSPQAKGRVERLFQTLQDRLVKALREAGAATQQEANRVLVDFLPRFDERFKKEAAQPGSAYREWPADLRPSDVFCFKYMRTVRNDNTISFDNQALQIPPGRDRLSYARARVQVRLHLDGQLTVHYKDEQIAAFQPAEGTPVRADRFTPAALPKPEPAVAQPEPKPLPPSPRRPHKPPPDHPWRRPWKREPTTMNRSG